MSYANMDGVPTQTAGTSEILASDWNTYVRDNFDALKAGHIVCTSGTRPTGLVAGDEGLMIYETDTKKTLTYSGSAWIEVNDLDYSPAYTVCTSSTRPSSNLFEGQQIYETDTDKFLVWNGSAWADLPSFEPPTGMAYVTTGAALSSGTNITFGASTYDNDSMWNPATPTRLTANTQGLYYAYFQSSWTTSATGTIGLSIQAVNTAGGGTNIIQKYEDVRLGTTYGGVGSVVPLQVGDYITARFLINSGTVNISAWSGGATGIYNANQTRMGLVYLGKYL